MMSGRFGSSRRDVLRLFEGGSVAGLGDGELLERFAVARDEAAFDALVAKLGPMVLGVCRRMLSDPHDVDDAFQATFLVLVRRASSIRDRDLVGPWLHGVATKVARRARAESIRRSSRERVAVVAEVREESIERESDWPELRAMIDEEIERLPENHRRPVILCDVEGLTREEAALQLGWSLNMVRGRLERARSRLRGRLTRRGLAPSCGLMALLATPPTPSPVLLATTCRAACSFAVGRVGLASASAVALCRGVLNMMLMSKLKVGLAVVISTGFVAIGTGMLAAQGSGEKQEPAKPAVATALVSAPAAPAPTELAAERREADWTPLFNGKDLQGWKELPDHQGHWKVEDGAIVGKGDAGGYLFSEGDYENFHLRVEAQVNDSGDSGIFVRSEFGLSGKSRSGIFFPAGIETQIRVGGTNKTERTGSLANVRPVDDRLTQPNVWFTLEVIAEGGHIVIKVNDKTTVDFLDKPGGYSKGHIVLQQYTPRTIVKFRKIEIKELSKPKEAAAEPRAATDLRHKEGQVSTELNAERLEIARRIFDEKHKLFQSGRVELEGCLNAWKSLLIAEEGAATTRAARIEAIQGQIKVLKNLLSTVEARVDAASRILAQAEGEGQISTVVARVDAARARRGSVDLVRLVILDAEAHLIEVSNAPEGPEPATGQADLERRVSDVEKIVVRLLNLLE
jgi:RNA polymerase sigma factor (sigma-70 family)